MGVAIHKNQSGVIEGPVEFSYPQSVNSLHYALTSQSIFIDGAEMEVCNYMAEHGASPDVWTLTYRFQRRDDGEYAGDLVVRVDMNTSSGKAGTYTWIPKTESDEPLDTEGIMEFLNEIEVMEDGQE